jgi:hypothetical protein
MSSDFFIIKKGNPYVNYVVGVNLRWKGLDLSIDDVEDISFKNKIDYSNPIFRKVRQKLKVIKSNVYKSETIFDIEYLQSKKIVNKFGKRINQWTHTEVCKVEILLPPSTLSDFLI